MFRFLRLFKIDLYNVCVTNSMFFSEPKNLKIMEFSRGGNTGMIKSKGYLERYKHYLSRRMMRIYHALQRLGMVY